MFKNYLKIAVRNLRKYKAYSVINISGLAIGMACCILSLLFVQQELSYDKFHEHAGQIYRVTTKLSNPVAGWETHYAATSFPVAPALKRDYPEVTDAVRIYRSDRSLVGYEEKRFYEDRFFFADSTIFEVFSFPLLKGNPRTALKEPYSVVITEEMAKKYFGDDNPLDRALVLDNQHTFKVTGILKNLPRHSQLQFEFLASYITLSDIIGKDKLETGWFIFFPNYTYLRLPKGYPPEQLAEKLPKLVDTYMGAQLKSNGNSCALSLQPLADVHLAQNLENELETNGDVGYIYIFSGIAFIILLVACINFMNLATARSSKRAKEVGMRKVLGAYRLQLIKQFIGESLLISFVALLCAIALAELLRPLFTALIGKILSMDYSHNWLALLGFLTITLFVGIVSGSYPALFLSRFAPVEVLKGKSKTGSAGLLLRRGLVVVQFAVSVIFIVGALVVYQQMHYLKSKKLGFNKEQLITITIPSAAVQQKCAAMKAQFFQLPGVENVTASSSSPGSGVRMMPVRAEGAEEKDALISSIFMVDRDFIRTFGIELAAGRDFSTDFPADDNEAFILNEAAVSQWGWESADQAIGKKFELLWNDKAVKSGEIIGVMKNFHFKSLRDKIGPVVLHLSSARIGAVSVRIRPENIPTTIGSLEQKWHELVSNTPFEYSFLDDNFARLYQAEEKLGRIFKVFSILAIFIACLGVFGLISFATEQRTKEIGIRKVLGATVAGIVHLLSKEFMKLVFAANFIAWPIAYYAMNKWLQNFAYRVELDWWIFVLAGGLALLIALLTVSAQAIKAALANPVDSLRYE